MIVSCYFLITPRHSKDNLGLPPHSAGLVTGITGKRTEA